MTEAREDNAAQLGNKPALAAIVAIAGMCFVGGASAFTAISPESYMDEVFHVPMTQAYCNGDYDRWDPKITTPPGLYIFASAYASIVYFIGEAIHLTGIDEGGQVLEYERGNEQLGWCATTVIRQANWAFSLGTLFVMRALLVRRMAPGKALAHAILLWLYPISFFFSFLLYTDPGATFFFLLCYVLATGQSTGRGWARQFGSAIAGGIAILFRQTSAVWLAFTLAVCLLDDFGPKVFDITSSPMTGKTTDKKNDDIVSGPYGHNRCGGDGMLTEINLLWRLARVAIQDALRGAPLLRKLIPLVLPLVGFAVFVWGFNEGAIALGDKENHSAGGPPHLAHLTYVVAVSASLWGLVGKEAVWERDARTGFVAWLRRTGFLGCLTLTFAVGFGLWRYSLAHSFLLSDNRHYTFYVWRRFLSRPILRSALSPIYICCGWLVTSRLLERKQLLWVLTFIGATAAVLVPSPLLEPRYLTVPVLLAHLESRERSWSSLLAGVAACTVVNAATIYVFLSMPFEWHDGSAARFMW